MSGLSTRFNLSETGLNAVEAIQKLYAPQVHEDIRLFAFSSRLESEIGNSEVLGFENIPLTDSIGNVYLRTKIITNKYTFSDENTIWFDTLSSLIDPLSTVKISVDGSITNTKLVGNGTGYKVLNGSGQEVSSYPSEVNVRVLGKDSGSNNAVLKVEVTGFGRISNVVEVVDPGSDYIDGEYLELLPSCSGIDIPSEDKCLNYTGNSLYQDYYVSGTIGYPALLQNVKYRYRVRSADRNGFFVYDDLESEWLYLGSTYDVFQPRSGSIVIKREDIIRPENLSNLHKLNYKSFIYRYGDVGYSLSTGLGTALRSISNRIEDIRDNFSTLVQNSRIQKSSSEVGNLFGIDYNIYSGLNLVSDFRIIFRDPDSVLDTADFDFFELRDLLTQPGQVSINGTAIPGIFLNTGEKYQRVFSSDDKPFVSQSGKNYLSPRVYKLDSGSIVPANNTSDYKYSISTGYLKPDTTTIRGFDTEVRILIQNVSSDLSDGGFVFHRQLTTETSGSITSWPLLSYKDSSGNILDAKILAVS